jgi:hypothetical protein
MFQWPELVKNVSNNNTNNTTDKTFQHFSSDRLHSVTVKLTACVRVWSMLRWLLSPISNDHVHSAYQCKEFSLLVYTVPVTLHVAWTISLRFFDSKNFRPLNYCGRGPTALCTPLCSGMLHDYQNYVHAVSCLCCYPLHLISDILGAQGKARYHTTVALASGFHRIPLREDDRKKN